MYKLVEFLDTDEDLPTTMVEIEKHYCGWFVLIPSSIGFEI